MPRKESLKTTKPKKKKVVGKKLTEDLDSSGGTYFSAIRKLASKKTYYILLLVMGFLIFVYLMSRFLVVAWVDKMPVSRIKYLSELDKKYGKEVKEQLIVEKLLENEAKKKNVIVSAPDIANETKRIEDAQGGADQLNQILEVQGISKDEFKKLVRLQILKQKVFGGDAAITDEEVNKYIETNKEQFKDIDKEASTAAKTKEMLKEQLRQQKINASFNSFLGDALKGPRVVRVQ